MTIHIKSDPKNNIVYAGIDKIKFRHMKGLRGAMYDIGNEVKSTLKKRVLATGGRTGIYYKYKGTSIRASAANEDPANRSGKLERSIDYGVRGYSQVEFGSRTKHGLYLERGTKHMKPRRFIERVANDKALQFATTIYHITKRELGA